ncbi:oxysterol-binding protein-related protein 9-like [Eriocheir sinensis]|uniref:oxysterol-binding protein-related protein 9-like n=1 Tax=Eriocheir sinensis TaxID=95602 RepID=UPI0021C6183C|nr:oxysterol-binding protein-related protein 9-like [Eriocheir sinensis]
MTQSKEKMMRGARRGCVRLKGAVVGIDDDDDSTFTITVDAKTFHFQAHDPDEREKWIRGLEDTIVRHTPSIRRWDPSRPAPTMADFDKKLTESDAYLQLLIEQSGVLERHMGSTEDPDDRRRCQEVLNGVNSVLESIKHSIVLLQIAKNTAFPVNGVYHPCNAIPESTTTTTTSTTTSTTTASTTTSTTTSLGSTEDSVPLTLPPMVQTLSEDEDFFDADDFGTPTPSQSPR